MTDIRSIQAEQVLDPTLPAHLSTKRYADGAISSAPTDLLNYDDLFSPVERRIATSQDTASLGFLTFTGGPARIPIAAATKLRFHVRGIVNGSAAVTMALYKGTSRTALAKIGSDITVTSSFAAIGIKELTIPSFSCDRGDFVYLGILRLGAGSPDPAMATSGGPATADLFNPDSTHFVCGFKASQTVLPNPLDTSAGYSGSGRIFWFSLA
jgi:hypothetical protein